MDSKDYEDWFGIPLEKKEEEEELEEGEIKDNSIKDIKENNFNNKNIHKSFLSKKRKNVNPFEENDKNNNDNIINIKDLKGENTQNNEEKIKKEKIPENNNNELNKHYSSNNKYHHIIDELNNNGKTIIKFNGLSSNNINPQIPNLKHYVFLRTQNDFNSESENMEFKWKITFTCNYGYIGIGVADKHVVNQNKHLFYSKDKNFYNGTFCLYTVFNRDKNSNVIYQWHPNDPNLNRYAVNFVPFKQNQEITLVYNTCHKTLIFYAKIKNKKYQTFKMINVRSKGPVPRTILTPCVVFFYPNDTIQISKLETLKYKEHNK